MITGVVTVDRMAVIPLTVLRVEGQSQKLEAIIDTGFDGSLTLPPALIASLGLRWRQRGRALLADGSESVFDIYEATVLWDSQPRRVLVDAADMVPLVGMALLYGYELTIQTIDGGPVMIRRLQ